MQFIDLKKQQDKIRESLDARIKSVLDNGQYILGKEVNLFEENLSQFADVKHSIGCSNGTDALILALMALDIGPGDGVITVPFTYIATLEAIVSVGATPVLVDVYDSTFNINPEEVEKVINNSKIKIKAIMPVDLFGLPARYRMINEIAKKYSIKVIGDAAQSFGASINNQKIGSFADITTTSFFPAKPLGCYGDGGGVFTNDENLSNKLKSLRVHGKGVDKYDNINVGLNSRLDTIQAAILLEKLKIFPNEIDIRNEIADYYREKLSKLPLKFQVIPKKYKSVYAQFSILFETGHQRDLAQNKLGNNGIPSVIYYRIPCHLQSGYSFLNYKLNDFPISEKLSERILSLPMHPYLKKSEIDKICETIEKCF